MSEWNKILSEFKKWDFSNAWKIKFTPDQIFDLLMGSLDVEYSTKQKLLKHVAKKIQILLNTDISDQDFVLENRDVYFWEKLTPEIIRIYDKSDKFELQKQWLLAFYKFQNHILQSELKLDQIFKQLESKLEDKKQKILDERKNDVEYLQKKYVYSLLSLDQENLKEMKSYFIKIFWEQVFKNTVDKIEDLSNFQWEQMFENTVEKIGDLSDFQKKRLLQ